MNITDLIDRSKVLQQLCAACSNMGSFACIGCAIPGIVKEIPKIDAEPVLHAIWINDTYCSNCQRFPVDVSFSISNQQLTKYFSRCPHCGAKMDAKAGGAEND